MRVRVDLNISLDGVAQPTDGTPDNPYAEDWSRITAAYAATRTFRARVFGLTDGSGTTGIDEDFAAAYFDGIGAEIMGAAMFGLHVHPNDPGWQGWWGDHPPFHVPVFVLTYEQRSSPEMQGGTVFHFAEASPHEILARAVEAAGGLDVRVGGGLSVVRDFLDADLVDDVHVAIAPVVLGQGIRLWDELRSFDVGRTVTTVVAESGTIHVTLSR